MRAVCVDDEQLILEMIVAMCREIPALSEVKGFFRAQDALDWIDGHKVDVALLDIDMPDMNGLDLAEKIRDRSPETAVIFLTGHDQFAVDAFAMHVSGYLLKPIGKQRLEEEVNYALSSRKGASALPVVSVRTFGNFEIMVNGTEVLFKRSKAKEILAFLVDRQGAGVSRPQLFASLWEEKLYTRSQQKQLDVIIRSLRETLKQYGISDIFEMRSGMLKIFPQLLDCDLYRFLEGDPDTVRNYKGEYMSSWSWAAQTEAYLDRKFRNFVYL